jgi:GDP-mannose 6-dehydrogenase
LDLAALTRVCEQVGAALRNHSRYHVVVVRSTVLPGTTQEVLTPLLERASGGRYGETFGVAVNPEFLREGTALADFRRPPFTLVGHNHAADASGTAALYAGISTELVSTSIRVAEMIKYAGNAWHALKVCFANEIGNLCKPLGIDSHEVMDLFCRDEKLNLSSSYLKPGFAFGGSCLPKDVRALQYRAKELDIDLPLIQSILPSNRLQIQHALDEVLGTGKRRVGLLGFSFKAGTDDLRESPMVILAESLLGKGLQLAIYDKNVSLARLVGANKSYIEEQIPHLASLLRETVDEVIAHSEVIVVGNRSGEFAEALLKCQAGQTVIDLVRVPITASQMKAEYRGICW